MSVYFRIVVLVVCAAVGMTAAAQWTQTATGGHIYNTNTGNVGIGTTAPSATHKFELFSPSIRLGDGGSFNFDFNMPAASTFAARFRTAGSAR